MMSKDAFEIVELVVAQHCDKINAGFQKSCLAQET